MALIKCTKCNKSITNTVKKCIHCGEPTKEKLKKTDNNSFKLFLNIIKYNKNLFIILSIIIILIGSLLFFINYNFNDNKHDTSSSSVNNIEDIVDDTINDFMDDDTKDNVDDDTIDIIDDSITTENYENDNVINSTKSYSCPNNYFLESDNTCVRTQFADSIIEYTCPEYFIQKGSFCENTIIVAPINGKCDENFVLNNNNNCEQVALYPAEIVSASCPANYSMTSDNNQLCIRIDKINSIINYTCPNGYTLNKQNKCER